MTTNAASLDWLIYSADLKDRETLFGNLERAKRIKKVKADRLLVELLGIEVIDELNDLGYDVFDDAKLAEIPSKLEELAKVHVAHKPWMLNCMADCQSNGELTGANIDGLKRFADVCNSAGVRSCGVTVLTTTTPALALRKYNGRSVTDQVLYLVEALVDCGFTDAVCAPTEAAAIRARGFTIDLNCASIRMPDDPPDDQARTMTPAEAREAGVTRQVVGRPINKSDVVRNIELLEANYNGLTA